MQIGATVVQTSAIESSGLTLFHKQKIELSILSLVDATMIQIKSI